MRNRSIGFANSFPAGPGAQKGAVLLLRGYGAVSIPVICGEILADDACALFHGLYQFQVNPDRRLRAEGCQQQIAAVAQVEFQHWRSRLGLQTGLAPGAVYKADILRDWWV
jgi:hypothetical protein